MPEATTKQPTECDLVMKGGITSGIVYPPAILELEKRFKFRSIGGASAGAIAAALTAAAELGRNKNGFEKLKERFEELTTEGFILSLFAAPPQTKPLLDLIVGIFLDPTKKNESWAAWVYRALKVIQTKPTKESIWGSVIGALCGFLPALFLVGAAWFGLVRWPGYLVAAGGVLMGMYVFAPVGQLIGAVVYAARVLWGYVPKEGHFGLCKGYEGEGQMALTKWLHEALEELAGHSGDNPLTFNDLEKAQVHLRMVTSNLSHHQPYVLPFRSGEERFIFNEGEMKRFFPERVVEYMKRESKGPKLPEGFYFLPEGDALPVIVATRLSLSFPILLCAIKLYTINGLAYANYQRAEDSSFQFQRGDLQDNWFSDGGISSNFPIHFFDAWLPQRPTFGIDLADAPKPEKDKSKQRAEKFSALTKQERVPLPEEAVHLPEAKEEVLPRWIEVASLPDFGAAIFNTAQNYRDSMQSRLPSYRERIVQIQLGVGEGGLNLQMTKPTMKNIANKGEKAGKKLVEQYSQGTSFRQHQWVRLRVLMHYLEGSLFQIQKAFPNQSDFGDLFNEQLKQREKDSWYCSEDQAWCRYAEARLALLLNLLQQWQQAAGGKNFFEDASIKPEAALRVTPPV